MVYCTVPYCTSDTRKEKISFHEFPSDLELRKKWLLAISRRGETRGSQWVPNQYSSICGKHFLEDDFKPSLKRRILKPGVVPSIFPGYPSYMTKEKVTERPLKRRRINEKAIAEDNSQNSDSFITVNQEVPSGAIAEDNSQNSDSFITVNQEVPTDELSSKLNNNPVKSTPDKSYLYDLKRKYRNTLSSLCKARKRIKSLKKKCKNYNDACNTALKDLQKFNIKDIETLSKEGDAKSVFILDQLLAHEKKNPRWSEETIRFCILWQSRYPSGYRYVRNLGILKLPSQSALKKYLGYGHAETGINSLVKQRLIMEEKKLPDVQLLGSLIIDEMSIKPMLSYDKMKDKLIGPVDLNGKEEELGLEKKISQRSHHN